MKTWSESINRNRKPAKITKYALSSYSKDRMLYLKHPNPLNGKSPNVHKRPTSIPRHLDGDFEAQIDCQYLNVMCCAVASTVRTQVALSALRQSAP